MWNMVARYHDLGRLLVTDPALAKHDSTPVRREWVM